MDENNKPKDHLKMVENMKAKDLIMKRRIDSIISNSSKKLRLSSFEEEFTMQKKYFKMHLQEKDNNYNEMVAEFRKNEENLHKKYANLKNSQLAEDKHLQGELHSERENNCLLQDKLHEVTSMYNDLAYRHDAFGKTAELELCQFTDEVKERDEKLNILEDYIYQLQNDKFQQHETQDENKTKRLHYTIQELQERLALLETCGFSPAELNKLRGEYDAQGIELFKLKTLNKQLSANQENGLLLKEKLRCSDTRKDDLENRIYELNKTKKLYEEQCERGDISFSIKYVSSLEQRNLVNINNITKLKSENEDLRHRHLEQEKELVVCLQSRDHNLKLFHELDSQTSYDKIEIAGLKKKVIGQDSILDSYQNLPDTSNTQIEYHEETADMVELSQETNRQLQKSLKMNKDYGKMILKLKKDIRILRTENIAKDESSEELMKINKEENMKLREELTEYSNEIAIFSQKLEIAESQLELKKLEGHYDPETEKILHFTLNPAAIAQKQLVSDLCKYKSANDKLKVQLSKLADRLANNSQNVTSGDQSVLEIINVSDLQARLAKEELKNEKLLEAFQKNLEKFRVGCYKLTGYEIKLKKDMYSVQSRYASEREHLLLFQELDSGEMIVLENPYIKSLEEDVDLYLKKFNSIPMLLASQTIKLHADTTIALMNDTLA